MKSLPSAQTAPDLAGAVERARRRLAKAEAQLARAKELARLARQRRKAAKQAARRAKRRAKQLKASVAVAQRALAELEIRLPKGPAKHTVAIPRRKNSRLAVALQAGASSIIQKPSRRRLRSQTPVKPAGETVPGALPVPQALVTPVLIVPPEDSKATPQIVRGVEEIFTGEIQAEAVPESGVQPGLPPETIPHS